MTRTLERRQKGRRVERGGKGKDRGRERGGRKRVERGEGGGSHILSNSGLCVDFEEGGGRGATNRSGEWVYTVRCTLYS